MSESAVVTEVAPKRDRARGRELAVGRDHLLKVASRGYRLHSTSLDHRLRIPKAVKHTC